MPKPGLILFAHGARDPRWSAPFEAVAERLRRQHPDTEVRLAYLELMTPSLAAAGAELAALGCRRIAVLPMFLGAGGHVRKDLPLLLADLQRDHPGVEWTLHAPLGEQPEMIDAMAAFAASLVQAPGP